MLNSTKSQEKINAVNKLSYEKEILLEKMSKAQRSILDHLIAYGHRFQNIDISQEWLATLCGISRQYANEVLKLLWKWGFISKIARYRRTCIYRLLPCIRTQYFKNKYKDLFPSLVYVFFISSLTIQTCLPKKDDTILNLKENIYLKATLTMERDTKFEIFHLPKDIKTEKLEMYDFSIDESPIANSVKQKLVNILKREVGRKRVEKMRRFAQETQERMKNYKKTEVVFTPYEQKWRDDMLVRLKEKGTIA